MGVVYYEILRAIRAVEKQNSVVTFLFTVYVAASAILAAAWFFLMLGSESVKKYFGIYFDDKTLYSAIGICLVVGAGILILFYFMNRKNGKHEITAKKKIERVQECFIECGIDTQTKRDFFKKSILECNAVDDAKWNALTKNLKLLLKICIYTPLTIIATPFLNAIISKNVIEVSTMWVVFFKLAIILSTLFIFLGAILLMSFNINIQWVLMPERKNRQLVYNYITDIECLYGQKEQT